MPLHFAPAAAPVIRGQKLRVPGWRWTDLRFLLLLLLPAAAVLALHTHPEQFCWGAAFFYLAVVVLEVLWPNVKKPAAPGSWPSAYFSGILRLYVPMQLVLQFTAAWVAWQSDWATVLGIGFGVGLLTGALGTTVAHELGHSPYRFDRFLAWVLMTSVGYAQFMVEHYRGHHPRASTWADPASSRRGESLWRFLPRTLSGSLVHAWKLEARRLHQLGRPWGRSPLVWSYLVKAFGLLALVAGLLGKVLVFTLVQVAVAVLLLETVNYIEHYGLQRLRRGRHLDRFKQNHAWNANHALTNALLINLQRHSDHHINAWKPYVTLEWTPAIPQLPTGYAGSILLAMVPRVWFAVMNPRLERIRAEHGGDDAPTRPGALGSAVK